MILALIVKILNQSVQNFCMKKRKNSLFNAVYRSPNGKIEPFEDFLKILFNKNKNPNKNYHIAGDFNLN